MQQPESVVYLPPNTVDVETPEGILIYGNWRQDNHMSSISRTGANNFKHDVKNVRDTKRILQ